jgi:hypothetical protein
LWFNSNSIVVAETARELVEKAKAELDRHGKSDTPSRIVAELNFGFWTGLMSSSYKDAIWERPKLAKEAFPYMSKYDRKRSALASRFTAIRHLRNRISHHEPIWNRTDLAKDHSDILEALGWIHPSLKTVSQLIDRFPIVSTSAFLDALKQKLNPQQVHRPAEQATVDTSISN